MPWITSTSGVGRQPEGFILDPDGIVGSPLDLGTRTSWLRLASLTIPPAQKLPTWASNGDSDGQQLVRTPYYGNRDQCQMQVRVNASDGDSAMYALGVLENKLQEADRLAQDGGLPALWTPSGATTGLTLYILLAQITDMPITINDGWFAHKLIVTVAFTCKPFLYGEETSIGAVTGTDPIVSVTVPNVPGDVPAEARLVISVDALSQARRFVEWGLEQHHYNAGSPAPVFIDSASLVTSGFGGTALAHSGAYGGTTIATPLISQPVAVCGTGPQSHIGTYRVKARVYGPSTSEYWRLNWQDGDGPYQPNDWVQPIAGSAFSEIDFGMIDVDPAVEGVQRWSGRIEAYTTTGGETGELDYLELYPAGEGYGRLTATYGYQPGVIVAHDEFTGTTAGSVLNGRTAPAGGTWATSGASTDFVFADGPQAGDETIKRTTESDSGYRYAILGSGGITDTEVGAAAAIVFSAPGEAEAVAIARWTSSSAHLRLRAPVTVGATEAGTMQLILEQVVGGTPAVLGGVTMAITGIVAEFFLRLIAFSSGRVIGELIQAGNTVLSVNATSAALATGGTLASGVAGLADYMPGTGGTQRYYDNFYVATPAAEPLVLYAGRTLEVRSDSNLRQSSDGTSYGDVASRGGRLFIPPAGDANRTTRIAVKAARDDLTTMADSALGDSVTAQVFYTPRYLAVPR